MIDRVEMKELRNLRVTNSNITAKEYGCWAKSEMCKGLITREHVISDSILKCFKNMKIELGDRTINASSKSYVIRSLCEYHNKALSPFDNEALKLFSGWKRITSDCHLGMKHPGAASNHINIDIDSIEKWFAKTFVNRMLFKIMAEKPTPNILAINPMLVSQRIFSDLSFEPPFGVYLFSPLDPLIPKRKAWSFGEHYVTITRVRDTDNSSDEYRIPSLFYCSIGGIELVGFFNISQFTDQYALDNFLGPVAQILQKRGTYREGINFAGASRTIRKGQPHAPKGSVIFVGKGNLEHPVTKQLIIDVRDGLNIAP